MITLQERVHTVSPPKSWCLNKLHRVFRVRKGHKNLGMQEKNLLSLSYGKIVQKDIDAAGGLLPESFETYQIVEPGNIVMRLTDLQNDKRSLRQGLVKERGIITSAYDALEVGREHDARYWAYALLALDLAKYYYSLGAGVRQSIKFSDFPNDWIGAPDTPTQKAIADYLDRETARIDQLIEKKQRFAELVLLRREARIADAVVGKSEKNSLWFGKLPDGWKAERAKFHFRERQEQSVSGNEELLTVSHITGVTKRSAKAVNMFLAESNEGYNLVTQGDLVINTMWAWMGAMGSSPEDGLISPSYGVYRPTSGELNPDFIDLLVRSRPFVAEATRRSKGIHSSRLRLYPDAFLDILLPIPPLPVQEEIVSKVGNRIERENQLLRKNEQAEELLREYRAALITAAVIGQIDVSFKAVKAQAKPDRAALRVLVGAEVVHRHRNNRKFGRVKFQKELYLAEAYAGISELEGNYLRKAAGPHDQQLMDDVEGSMAAQGYYRADQPDGNGSPVAYIPMENAGQHAGDLKSALGSRADKLSAMIDLLRDFDTNAVEAIATLYAVWNDLLAGGITPEDDTIIHHALTEWHPEKSEKFRTDDLAHWLGWMKRHDFVPTGSGPVTTTGRLFA